ncbi:MAG: hydrogenase small subunit, partial [Eubacteriales bacterium]|nr:hydrogenase small subunit [Eubacteriales bacterium]
MERVFYKSTIEVRFFDMRAWEEIISKEISRRDFMKLCAAVTAIFSLPPSFSKKVAYAVEEAMKKPPVIWLEG